MLLAAGLTPAWQQIMVFDRLAPGEVNRAREVHWCASGKVLNVGRALVALGAPSKTISPLGGPAHDSIVSEFRSAGIQAAWLTSASATRTCTTLADRATGQITELVENALPIAPVELQTFIDTFAREAAGAEWAVLTGSLPPGTPTDIYRTLIALTSAKIVLDARGPELLAALEARPFLVKPNRYELGLTVDRPLDDDSELLSAMRELNARGAEWVLVSDGARPAWLTSGKAAYQIHPTPVEPVNPIGSGDCLAAGTAWALSTGHDPVEAVRIGMAAAAENALALLPARLASEKVIARASAVRVTFD